MSINFTQTDDSTIHCDSADTNSECIEGGAVGTSEQTFTVSGGAVDEQDVNFEIDITNEVGVAGSWVVRINVTTSSSNITWNSVSIIHRNAACVLQETLKTDSGLGINFDSPGIFSTTLTSVSSPSLSSGDVINIKLGFANSEPHMDVDIGFTPDQDIDTPLIIDEAADPNWITEGGQQPRNIPPSMVGY